MKMACSELKAYRWDTDNGGGQQAAIQNMYSSSIKCPLSKVHCLSKTKTKYKKYDKRSGYCK